MADPQAGWYPDPSGDSSKLRYWNGAQWTDDYTAIGDEQPAPQQVVPQAPYSSQPGAQAAYRQPDGSYAGSTDETLRLIAFIFCIISTVSVCWAIIPLAWMIPMTVHSWGIYKGTKSNTTAFGVCTLLFVSLVAGILLLVSKKDYYERAL